MFTYFKKYLLFLILILWNINIIAQNNSTIYQAYLNEDMTLWKQTMDSLDAIPNQNEQQIFHLLNFQYGYVAYCIDIKNDELAEKYINKADKIIETLEQKEINLPLTYAYKSAFTGFKISLTPYKAPFLGVKSSNYAEKSVQMNRENIFGYVQLGNIAYYSPSLFGGSKKEALKYYLKALKLMEQNPLLLKEDWNYLNLLVNIIMSHIKLEQKDSAIKYYKKTIYFEPNFEWLKQHVQPQ